MIYRHITRSAAFARRQSRGWPNKNQDRVSPSFFHENEVISIECIPLGLPLAVGCRRRVYTICDEIRKVQLTGDHVALADCFGNQSAVTQFMADPSGNLAKAQAYEV